VATCREGNHGSDHSENPRDNESRVKYIDAIVQFASMCFTRDAMSYEFSECSFGEEECAYEPYIPLANWRACMARLNRGYTHQNSSISPQALVEAVRDI
jgi:hypothetical protein